MTDGANVFPLALVLKCSDGMKSDFLYVSFLISNIKMVWFFVTYLTDRLHTSRSAVFDYVRR